MKSNSNYDVIMERTKEYREWRFGLFVHYGLYSVAGRNEWCKSIEKISDEHYQNYFDVFSAEHYDPEKWAKQAKRAGMKYAVLTTKHHDGFCLFDSKYTDYKSTNTKANRDLVKEFVEAFRKEGIAVGLYYSLIDWHHPDYPKYNDPIHPMRGNDKYKDEQINFNNYLTYMHSQVRELLTNYGKIDIMWFDFSYGEMNGEKWKATELVNMARSLQPDIIIDNRLYRGGKFFDNLDEAPVFCGDFTSPEQFVPSKGITDSLGRIVPWETCLTTQVGSWCYMNGNENFMSARQAIFNLVDCVSKNGNLLLNVGPTAKGDFPEQAVELLDEIGKWMYQNGESIYGCGGVDAPQPEWGRLTTDGKNVYAHVFDIAGQYISLKGVKKDAIKFAIFLEDCTEVPLGVAWDQEALQKELGGDVAIALGKAKLKNGIDTVIKLIPYLGDCNEKR